MNKWNMVMLGLAIVLAGIAIPFASRVYKIRNAWEQGIDSQDKAFEQTKADLVKTLDGSGTEPGARIIAAKLANFHQIRGTVWENTTPTQFNEVSPEQAAIQIKLDPEIAASAPLETATIVYIFETPRPAGPDEENGNQNANVRLGGAFLGAFRVTKVQGETVNLESTENMSASEMKRLQDSVSAKTNWSLYKSLPADREDVFQNLMANNRELFDKIVPQQFVDKFSNPDRPLFDYGLLLAYAHQERTKLNSQIALEAVNLEGLQASLAQSQKEQQETQKDIDQLRLELDAMKSQSDEVKKYLAEVDKMLQDLNQQIATQQSQNEQLVSEIAKSQLQAAQSIEARGGTQ